MGLATWLLRIPIDTVERLSAIFIIGVALLIQPAGREYSLCTHADSLRGRMLWLHMLRVTLLYRHVPSFHKPSQLEELLRNPSLFRRVKAFKVDSAGRASAAAL